MESFAKLEERINKAVAHIEKLMSQNEQKSALIEELEKANSELKIVNDDLKGKIKNLEGDGKTLAAAKVESEKQSQEISERVKDKIEGLLARIEKYEESTQ
jgi:alpha-galactosidase/6-phospho-beta-glucosidase family protein